MAHVQRHGMKCQRRRSEVAEGEALNLPNLSSLKRRSSRSDRRKPKGMWTEPRMIFGQKGMMEMTSTLSHAAL